MKCMMLGLGGVVLAFQLVGATRAEMDLAQKLAPVFKKSLDTNVLHSTDVFLRMVAKRKIKTNFLEKYSKEILESTSNNLLVWSLNEDDEQVDLRYAKMRAYYGVDRYSKVREFYLTRLNSTNENERVRSATVLVRGLCDMFAGEYLVKSLERKSNLSVAEVLTYADLISRLHDGRCFKFLQDIYADESNRVGYRVVAAKALIRIGQTNAVVSAPEFVRGSKSFSFHVLESLPVNYWENDRVIKLSREWLLRFAQEPADPTVEDRLFLSLILQNLPAGIQFDIEQKDVKVLDGFAHRLVRSKDAKFCRNGGHLANFTISDENVSSWFECLGKVSDEYTNALILGAVYRCCSPKVIRDSSSMIRPMLKSCNFRVQEAAVAVLERGLGRRYVLTDDMNTFSNHMHKVVKEVFNE